jgi:hypothetical protein
MSKRSKNIFSLVVRLLNPRRVEGSELNLLPKCWGSLREKLPLLAHTLEGIHRVASTFFCRSQREVVEKVDVLLVAAVVKDFLEYLGGQLRQGPLVDVPFG